MSRYKNIMGKAVQSAGFWGAILLMTGCQSEDDLISHKDQDGILFHASMEAHDGLSTRANNSIYDIEPQFYGCDFFVREKGFDDNNIQEIRYGKYIVQSGYSGTLIPKAGEPSLNWLSRDKDHNFSIFTVPFQPDFKPTEDVVNKGIELVFQNTDIRTDLKSSRTDPDWTDNSWKNGECLEQLIGGQTDRKYNFNADGMYVPVTLRHLVSKIMVKQMKVVDNSTGNSYLELRGRITLYGLPDRATYYPAELIGDGEVKNPYVAMPSDWAYDQSKGVMYTITNNYKRYDWEGTYTSSASSTTYKFRDCWYICPEVDLSKLSYKIELFEFVDGEWIPHRTRGTHGAFYGDFKSIKLSRGTTGSNYDDPNNTTDTKYDATILHAGEYLALNMTLNEKGAPVIRGEIYSWWGGGDRYGSCYVEQGIYSLLDMEEFNSNMKNNNPDDLDEYFTVAGARDTGDDPEGEYPDYEKIFGKEQRVFEIFDDLGKDDALPQSTSSQNKNSYVGDITVQDGYILDGKGHTLNVYGTEKYTSGVGYEYLPKMQIGNIRDVYLHFYYRTGTAPNYTYQEYMIYIDKMGQVYTVDVENGTYVETPVEGMNVNEMSKKKNPMTIDLITGKLS